MDCQEVRSQNQLSFFSDLTFFSKDEVSERLTQIYKEILAIEEENPSADFNKNISFANKIHLEDPLFIEVLKCAKIAGFILTKKPLTDFEIDQVAIEYTRLKNQKISEKNQYENIKEILKTARNIDVFYKAVAAASYYFDFHENQLVETAFGVYKIGAVIGNDQGLRALYFEPKSENNGKILSPILSIRGTVSGNLGNALDDLHSSIGSLAFESGKEELFNLLVLSLEVFPQACVVVGHSLGGAIAQQMAAAFAKDGLISQVYHYNAPGVGLAVVNQFIENSLLADNTPEIIEVRHESDILSYFGGDHLPSDNRVIIKDCEQITYHVAHEILRLMEKSHQNLLNFEIVKKPEELGFWRGRYNYFTLETLRWVFAPFLRFIAFRIFSGENPSLTIEDDPSILSNIQEVSEEELFLKKT